MAVFVSLLRGINVGGNKPIRMDALNALYERLGFARVRTLLQSGNVTFDGGRAAAATLGTRIERAIAAEFGFDVTVIVRTSRDLRDIVARNPFPDVAVDAPSRLVVVFFAVKPTVVTLDDHGGPETVLISGREAFVHYPNGQGRSKLTNTVIEKRLGVAGTARNWNTVRKLAEMASGVN